MEFGPAGCGVPCIHMRPLTVQDGAGAGTCRGQEVCCPHAAVI